MASRHSTLSLFLLLYQLLVWVSFLVLLSILSLNFVTKSLRLTRTWENIVSFVVYQGSFFLFFFSSAFLLSFPLSFLFDLFYNCEYSHDFNHAGIGFDYHRNKEHNTWDYLFFIIYLINKKRSEFSYNEGNFKNKKAKKK